MSGNQSLISKEITWLRFPLIFCVLIIHSNFSVINGGWGNQPVASWLSNHISSLAFICNPAFFFISGMLFFKDGFFNIHIYAYKLRRRIHSLLIPYVIWNTIYLFILCLAEQLKTGFTAIIDKPICQFDINDFLFAYYDISKINGQGGVSAPIDIPLWFVRNLLMIVLISPVIFFIIKMLSRKGKAITVVVLSAIIVIFDSARYFNEFRSDILFFSIGAYFGIEKNIIFRLRKYTFYLLIASIVLFLLNFTLSSYLLFILSLFQIVAFMLSHNYIRIHNTLSQATFFIFASHQLVQGVLYIIVRRGFITFNNEWSAILCYILFPVIMAVTCLTAFVVMHNLTPNILTLLTGNRIK